KFASRAKAQGWNSACAQREDLLTPRLAGRLQHKGPVATELSERFSGRYLRYQFDNAAQILRHCRLVEGAVLLFFPDPAATLPIRARALMELCLTASDQQVAIPAQVHSPEKRGSWLAIRALSV